MATSKSTFPQTEPRLETVAARIEKDKKALVEQLRKTPIVQLAVERVGVGRSTYYKWRADDDVFATAADEAIEAGKFFINDIAESKLLQLIQNSNLTAIIFWLKSNHPSYTTRCIHEYDLTCPRTSIEQEHREGMLAAYALTERLAQRSPANQIQDAGLPRKRDATRPKRW